ncbi:hypothetical protein [Allohahella marinimesophila]|uniref:Deaminase n=1 Tax=Allohahella marinimesophila TaxID=1054972 RepID=A0ABP7PIN7_9GAMM
MGLLTFSLNVTLDGCVDHHEGIADCEPRRHNRDALPAHARLTL